MAAFYWFSSEAPSNTYLVPHLDFHCYLYSYTSSVILANRLYILGYMYLMISKGHIVPCWERMEMTWNTEVLVVLFYVEGSSTTTWEWKCPWIGMLRAYLLCWGNFYAFDRGSLKKYRDGDQKERLSQYGQTYRRVQVVSPERNASPHTNLPSQVVFLLSLQKKSCPWSGKHWWHNITVPWSPE